MSETPLATGDNAPAFEGVDEKGVTRRLADYRGSWLLLYFYPKDDTPGCTTEACGLRDRMSELIEHGVAVLGVSADDQQSHTAFSEKHALNFPLIADTTKTIIQSYGAWGEKLMYGKSYMGILRQSFLISPTGVIVKKYENVSPETHAEEVMKDLASLKARE